MSSRSLRLRCERLVQGLELPDPFDIHELCRRIGEQQGRALHTVALPLPPDKCGLWVRTKDFDVIFYQSDTSPMHQELIIGHEIGHLLAGHVSTAVLDADAAQLLLPDLDPALVHSVLGRTTYSQQQEREAELTGTLLVGRARRLRTEPDPPARNGRQGELYQRLRRALEHPDR
jgi:hypothetical protein